MSDQTIIKAMMDILGPGTNERDYATKSHDGAPTVHIDSADGPSSADVDSLIMAADQAVASSDDLARWASEAPRHVDAADRWKAVATTRELAIIRYANAARLLRGLSPFM